MKKDNRTRLRASQLLQGYVHIGDYAYANGSFSKKLIPDFSLVGVVAWVNPDKKADVGNQGLIVSLEEEFLSWPQAFLYCQEYQGGELLDGKRVLATKTQWQEIFSQKERINQSLRDVKAPELLGWYWSSSDYDSQCAWSVGVNNGSLLCQLKSNKNMVRRLIAF